jgi:hypothetical protein
VVDPIIRDHIKRRALCFKSKKRQFQNYKLRNLCLQAEVNDRNTIVPLNSYSSNAMSSSEDDDSDFRDIHFPQESALQQVRFCTPVVNFTNILYAAFFVQKFLGAAFCTYILGM